MSGFKNFVMRGNLVELAVAVVIGTRFSALVKQFVSSFINPEVPGVHDEHPGRRPALPAVHRRDRARHRAAPAGPVS